jgi:enamine deaminase RidA (YjgF/YER057c/UK114 family)
VVLTVSTTARNGGAPTFLNPPGVGAPIGAYSHVAHSGDTYYIAGQVGVDRDGNVVGIDDFALQLAQTFKNIGDILRSVDLGFNNIAQMTTYITQRDAVDQFYAARTQLFPSLFGEAMYPPNTLLIVAGLVRPELLVEVQLIATG